MAKIQVALGQLADALQMVVAYNDGELSIAAPVQYKPVEGLTVVLTPQVKASLAGSSIGALIHVIGDLYMVLSTLESTGVVSAFLVDGKRCKMDEIKAALRKDSTVREVYDLMKKAILKSFMWRNQQWIPLNVN